MKELLILFVLHLLSPGPSFFFLIMNSLSKGRNYGASMARGISTADFIFATIAAFAFLLLSRYENSPILGYLMIAGGAWFIWKAIESIKKTKKHQLHNLAQASNALAKESFPIEAHVLENLEQDAIALEKSVETVSEIDIQSIPQLSFIDAWSNVQNNILIDTENSFVKEIKMNKDNQYYSLLEGYISGFKAGIFNIQAIMFFLALAIAGGIQKFTLQNKLIWIVEIALLSLIIRQSIAWFFTTPKVEAFFEKRQILIQTIFSIVMILFGVNIIHNAYLFLKIHGHA